MAYKRNYQKEYANETPARRQKRVNRNFARKQAMKQGLVRKGDGKDVHHVGGNALNRNSKLLEFNKSVTFKWDNSLWNF